MGVRFTAAEIENIQNSAIRAREKKHATRLRIVTEEPNEETRTDAATE